MVRVDYGGLELLWRQFWIVAWIEFIVARIHTALWRNRGLKQLDPATAQQQ
jgi:hypothetical protein